MKRTLTFSILLLMLGGCSQEEKTPTSIIEMTSQLIQFKFELSECDSLESCEKVSTNMSSYLIEVNHPENGGQLCNKYAECYEASVDLIQYSVSEEYINKLSSLIYSDD